MAPGSPARSFAPWVIALLIWIVARIACVEYVQRDADDRSLDEARVFVSERSETTMRPLAVAPPQQERWRDMADVAYRGEFVRRFDYEAANVRLQYADAEQTLRGTVIARGLKPSQAYQLKLVGLEPVLGADEASNAGNPRTWSSWQLGRLGRWWCEDCDWNVPDAELESHVADGHSVRGYLLFDWFVTDEMGCADHSFALDSSLHVLWRVGQRERGPNDTAPRWYMVERTSEAYPQSAANTTQQIGLFGEWEPDRPKIGGARLQPGEYAVGINLTEESFHANLGEDRELEGGGFWAWVMQAELHFDVRSRGG